MKYCPQCKRQFTEPWLSFCSDDGTPLVQELTPASDPNSDPRNRGTQFKTPSEQETQWLPPRQPSAGGWVAPDERPPISPGVWQPPPPPYRPHHPQLNQSLALTSMIVAIVGFFFGGCFGPVPGIIALSLGLVALSKIKNSPHEYGGKPFATAGVVVGSISAFIGLLAVIWIILSLALG